jgi:phospholipid/cholesterol/gamma-HCH transport system permease protein
MQSSREVMSPTEPAGFEWIPDLSTLRLTGSWTTAALACAGRQLERFRPAAQALTVDGADLQALDTAGAFLLYRLRERLVRHGSRVQFVGFGERRDALLALVEERLSGSQEPAPLSRPACLEQIGKRVGRATMQAYAMLSFTGVTLLALLRSAIKPARLRWRTLLAVVQNDGVRAMPVLGMLSFLLGVVIAYQSGVQLRLYGGNIYVVDLVTITVLRELGPLMTAIVVAGRSGSAYTAQIGTMSVTEELDALRSIGLPPIELLVLPRVLGLMVAVPLLTVFADMVAVSGGMVMAAIMLDVGYDSFLQRIPEAVSINSLLTGVAKAPVFAAVIAVVGCFQGFEVRGGADSVGRNTTTSVVQAIVLVIVVDAAFSVAYSWLGI